MRNRNYTILSFCEYDFFSNHIINYLLDMSPQEKMLNNSYFLALSKTFIPVQMLTVCKITFLREILAGELQINISISNTNFSFPIPATADSARHSISL